MTSEQRRRVERLLDETRLTSADIGRLVGVFRQAVAALKARRTLEARDLTLSHTRRYSRSLAGRVVLHPQLPKTPSEKAARTAKWARTMVKWLITHEGPTRRWEIVNFAGPECESRGIIDLMAIRKGDHHTADGSPRGDLFEIVLIQIKGGGARWLTSEDVARLRRIARRYRARAVVLATWTRGRKPVLYTLRPVRIDAGPRTVWAPTKASAIFGH